MIFFFLTTTILILLFAQTTKFHEFACYNDISAPIGSLQLLTRDKVSVKKTSGPVVRGNEKLCNRNGCRTAIY